MIALILSVGLLLASNSLNILAGPELLVEVVDLGEVPHFPAPPIEECL